MKRSKHPAAIPARAAAIPADRHWPLGAVFALLLGATFTTYLPCLKGDFLWDDIGHVTNAALHLWSGLWRIWFEPGVTQQYYPLLHSAFWLEHRLWGDATLGYHLINVLWHATSACLFVAILRRLAVPGALLAGLVFALHPVGVESVAWISEQKNTLSTVFCLAAALTYLTWHHVRTGDSVELDNPAPPSSRPSERTPAGSRRYSFAHSYTFATILFVCALLTKTVTATLPGALLVVVWWQRGRLSWRNDVAPLLPWLVLGLAAGLGTAWFERTQIGATGGDFTLSGVERGLLAGRVVWFYLGKLLWPVGLTFFYPRWTIDASVAWQWLFPLATLATLAAAAWHRRRDRGPLAAALLFGGMLFPVLGFVNVYPFVFSYVADHFQYLASLGMIAFFVAAATRAFAKLGWPDWSGTAVAMSVLLLLGGLTWRQSGLYRDIFALYEATLERNPSSWVAHLNLGTALDDAGRTGESLPHLQRANDLKPDHPETLNSLGNVLNRLGRASEARPLLERAIQLQPRFDGAHNTLGVSLMTLGQAEAGMAEFRRALEINPALSIARVNLGWALANQRRIPEALAEFEQALRQHPDDASAEYKLGLTLAMAGRLPEAVSHLARAVELQPEDPEVRYIFGGALMQLGRRPQAVEQFEETLRLNPNHAGAQRALDIIGRQ